MQTDTTSPYVFTLQTVSKENRANYKYQLYS